jgi:long-chain fatty acid transport protein
MPVEIAHHEGGFMKKTVVLVLAVLVSVPLAFSAIITNTNQSVGYFRLLARNASLDIDAVYYNPAGLTKLADGFHVALHNQSIWQDKTVTNDFILLNANKYVGKVRVPFYPDFYAVYKSGPLALSFGFGPNGGGGTADYATGLPEFETGISGLPTLLSLSGLPTTKYSADINFKGGSMYLGFQVNASYALSDMFSVAVGMRYISAKNTYTGAIANVMVNPVFPAFGLTGQFIPAAQLFAMLGNSYYAALFANKAVDVEQNGTGITPLFGLMVTPVDGLVLTLRYEFNTKLELTNNTTQDDTKALYPPNGLFPNGAKTRNDIPALLALGGSYAIIPELRAHVSYTLTFDKNANWDGREKLVDSNAYDLAFGLEFDLTKSLTLSAGYMRTSYKFLTGFQTDMNFQLPATTIGAGLLWKLNDQLSFDLGLINVNYDSDQKSIAYALNTPYGAIPLGSFVEHYQETTFGIGIGVNYHIK